jgi:RNA ligase (TIGR02306 family)
MEKLAVIAEVVDIQPIPDADKIEKASVWGWEVVVKKGLHQKGDHVVLIFPDTWVPKKFLDMYYQGEERVRLKTVKMKGQYSAGLVLPLSTLKEKVPELEPKLGEDVSSYLNIEKWSAPEVFATAGQAKGAFPTNIISKTDETNFRSEPAALEEAYTSPKFQDVEFVATLKCDGSSGTFIYKDGEFRVCSRNLELKRAEDNVFWAVAAKYKLEEVLSSLQDEYAIQGEVCGPGIQSNPMKLDAITLFVFQIKNLSIHTWLDWPAVREFCQKHEIPCAAEVSRFYFLQDPAENMNMLQNLANSAKYDKGKAEAEGIVVRPLKNIRSSVLQKPWSLKVMNQPYDMRKF